MTAPTDPEQPSLLDADAAAGAVERVYQQMFAVLAKELGGMVDVGDLDVDQAILDAFAAGDPAGVTLEQITSACRGIEPAKVHRRWTVLRGYQAIAPVIDRPNELRHRAAFAPYVMLLFLRRTATQRGQAEIHHLLTAGHRTLQDPSTTEQDAAVLIGQFATLFRLLANELVIMVANRTASELREQAQTSWGNMDLIGQAERVHIEALDRWLSLARECAQLRMALSSYRDAVHAAASRLVDQAGTTRVLGTLPPEAWLEFTRARPAAELAAALQGQYFDAPDPDMSPAQLRSAAESGRRTGRIRVTPPRTTQANEEEPPDEASAADDRDALAATAERALGGRERVEIADVIARAGDWISARRILADLTAAGLHDDLDYELKWRDTLNVDAAGAVPWVTDGEFRRRPR